MRSPCASIDGSAEKKSAAEGEEGEGSEDEDADKEAGEGADKDGSDHEDEDDDALMAALEGSGPAADPAQWSLNGDIFDAFDRQQVTASTPFLRERER